MTRADHEVVEVSGVTYGVRLTADRWHPWEYARAGQFGWERLGKCATREQAVQAISAIDGAGRIAA